MASVWLYSAAQLRVLEGKGVYASPAQGMLELVEKRYSAVNKVEIIHMGREIFDDLYFVEVHVWSVSRSDLKGFSDQSYDNLGYFFLKVKDGWVFVPEGKFPEVIALGKRIFRLSV